MVIERRQIPNSAHYLISFIRISRIGKTNNGDRNNNRVYGKGT